MKKPFSILIVGGGTAGWMAANLMAHKWGDRKVSITLLESDAIGTIGVGEGSTPYLKGFFKTLGIAESEWMPACNATYKCGIRFPHWSTVPGYESYYHPFFSPLDREIGQVFFNNASLRRSGLDAPANPTDFFHAPFLSSNAYAPLPEQPLPFELDYGYHFDAGLLGRFLRDRAKSAGVRHIVDTISSVERKGETIEAVTAEDTGRHPADFFVDCSGFRALLLGSAPGYQFRPFHETLFNNAAVTVQIPRDDHAPLLSETISEGLSSGWMWRIPLQNRTGCGYVYSDRFLSADGAESELRKTLALPDSAQVNHLRMKVGRVEEHWQGNCLGVGLSQGFIEPLEATALMLVQFTIEHFLEAFSPGRPEVDHASREKVFNQRINRLFDGVLDYVAGHYKLNSRDDTPYWRAAREEIVISDRLRALIDCWDKNSDVDHMLDQAGEELVYSRASWYSLLAGMGRFPKNLRRADTGLQQESEEVRRFCTGNLNRFRSHQAQLDQLSLARQEAEPA
ncbi:tryptophan halogenase [Microbulbifer flavimaris]|uniref:Tryptophan halogenase n=1 Tax=Microbulbifer flavimaris TaxID=1781068 RepID=A0ABX4HX38_9GAMM|nr:MULTISPECIES: tryptophan halogenase family protein [Microbulbifer]KUJ82481.1 tryptophan halogenase [Microbulbifer sp. ZGT114]PCO04685.1 tryptophan halogenase [Microbulbifer flavimaris]